MYPNVTLIVPKSRKMVTKSLVIVPLGKIALIEQIAEIFIFRINTIA